MHRKHKLLSITLLSAIALCARGNAVGGGVSRIQGHLFTARQMAGTERLGRRASQAPMNLSVGLKLRDQAGLDDLIARQNDPSDPLYHHFIEPEEFKTRFAPTDEQVKEVTDYLEMRGLRVNKVHPNNLIVEVEGDTATTEDAFQLRINEYSKDDGEVVFTPSAEPMIINEIAPRVAGVIGLDNLAKFHPHTLETRSGSASPSGSGLAPSDIRNAYGLNSSYYATGQNVALFQLDTFSSGDIDEYRRVYGIPRTSATAGYTPITTTYVDGASQTPGDGASEVTLDIELVLALAPKLANIYVYVGQNTNQSALNTYSAIANEIVSKRSYAVSSSWGIAEDLVSSSYLTQENTIFSQMASQGQSMFAASGDYGAYDDQRYNPTKLDVDDPASQPYVTGVGGTTLSDFTPASTEQAWSDTSYNPDIGGGGGISTRWTIPSFQQGLGTTLNQGSTAYRMVPDVSLHANPTNGYNIYFQGSWHMYGGTSCASPLWAAFTSLVNSARNTNGLGNMGFANKALYDIAQSSAGSSAFRDITSGTNLYFPARTGYDLATGWGSFNGNGLYNVLTSVSAMPPGAPSSATGTSTSTYIDRLSWATSTDSSITYDVYRSQQINGTFSVVGTSVATNTFTETVTYNPYYYYYVRAKKSSLTSAPSTRVSVAPYTAAPASAPTSLTATVTQ